MATYGERFFDYIEAGSYASAQVVLPLLRPLIGQGEVLDVGCGRGAWLAAYRDGGVGAVTGVDGAYVQRDSLMIPPELFHPIDIADPFDLGRRFALVQCLEVAEHLPPAAAPILVANLVRHAPLVLFSAATPGQGGLGHLNEQRPEYWRRLFAAHDYQCFDPFRPRLRGNASVEPWYRYNMLLYVHRSAVAGLPADFAATLVPEGAAIRDVSPLSYRLRCALMRPLPPDAVSRIAGLRHVLRLRLGV